VEKQCGPVTGVFRDLKAIFDPRRILNPGKVVGRDVAVPAWALRHQRLGHVSNGTYQPAGPGGLPGSTSPSDPTEVSTKEPAAAPIAPLQLLWTNGSFTSECMECNGCGSCRSQEPVERMCPIFRAIPDEAATPRAKANLLRRLLEGPGDAPPLSSDEVRSVANLCVNCKMCRQECPAHVNVPKLMLEAKAANVAEHGMRLSDWVLARTESLARIGSTFAPLINPALDNLAIRWCVEKLLGVSRHRRLPAFARRSFTSEARRRGWTHPVRSGRPRVAYFVDIFANYNDASIAEAAVAVLHHQGIEVHVPPGQVGCGMAALANGDVESAREALEHNLRVLAEPAREGYAIVCSEPTAAVMLAHDSLDLLDSPDARLVAGRVIEFTAFLEDLHAQGRLRTDFQPLELSVGHHVPCHIKALGRPPAAPRLLALIPGMRVQTLDTNCSGMAGTFGLKADNYDISLEAGRPMLERFARPGLLFGSTECSSCRVQMEGTVGKRTLHPAQYLALAYGLMPEMLRRLRRPIGERVLG
jgi:Fe-S oxidoreductase